MAGTITIVKVQRGTRASSQARFQSIALFAAESGIASGMEFLRTNVDPIAYFGAFISPNNSSVQTPPGIAGNSMAYLDPGNVFSGDTEMSYEVSVLNNAEDPGFAVGDDTDAVVTLRSVGKGPGTSSVVLEVSVDASSSGPLQIIRWRVIE
tara:strand:+ start:40722 stop:41174 length:453 start_codon:yes stop_codon:yes gene_type:complete